MINSRGKIIDKALELFNEKGVEYVGMRELATALGMRIGNITYYFPTKDHLVFSLSEQYSASNSVIHESHPVATLYDFLKKSELLYGNGLRYRSLVLSMVHLMEQNPMIAQQYEEVKERRRKGLEQNMKTLLKNKYLSPRTADPLWFLVSANSLINRFWMSEAALSGKRHTVENQMNRYLKLLALLFKPYATNKGVKDIRLFLKERE
jgi:AcrR family transcriptional regulator